MTAPDSARGWEGLFWTVFERSRNPMALVDEERRYVQVNPAHTEMFGRPSDEVVGTRLEDHAPPGDREQFLSDYEEFQRGGEFSGERSYVRPDGSVVRIRYAACSETVIGRELALLVSQDVADAEHDDPPGPGRDGEALSPREREVVRLVAMGMTSRQVADELTVSVETVRTHIRNALAKTGTRTRAQLVAQVMGKGLAG
ncbi:MAG: LuxR C-terminal-related transcriptional regulator [Thermoleophilaceae bacterium]